MENKTATQLILESLAFEIANPMNDESLRAYLQALYWYFKEPNYFEEQVAAQEPSFMEVAEVIRFETHERQMENDINGTMEKLYSTGALREIHEETKDLMHAFPTESPAL